MTFSRCRAQCHNQRSWNDACFAYIRNSYYIQGKDEDDTIAFSEPVSFNLKSVVLFKDFFKPENMPSDSGYKALKVPLEAFDEFTQYFCTLMWRQSMGASTVYRRSRLWFTCLVRISKLNLHETANVLICADEINNFRLI